MRNFKDIILEKLKIAKNNDKLPFLEDFEEALFDSPGHRVFFKDVDKMYEDSNNLPQLDAYCDNWKITSLFESKRSNGFNVLYAECKSIPVTANSRGKDEMVTSMGQLVRLIGEDLVLKTWDYMTYA